MSKLFKRSFAWGITITTTLFTFVHDSIIGKIKLFENLSDDCNLFINRIIILIAVFLISLVFNMLFNLVRRKIIIERKNYYIQIEYGNLLKCKRCQKIIPFDECFTTKVGPAPHEIKPTSICGQYLKVNPHLDIQSLIVETGIKPDKEKSNFKSQLKYTSGTIVPNGDDLLLAFAKLDKNGRADFPTREDYLKSLSVMWSEIHKYYKTMDVCIPILGGGQTTIGDSTPCQQELIEYIIESYKLFAYKIKKPQKLRIVCRKKDGISLNKIDEMI